MSERQPQHDPLAPQPKAKKDDLFWLGIGLTAAWLAIGIPVMLWGADRTNAPKPNEWGDIFAGLAAPVAFLWLVLGFKQQGRELQLSTRALELQVAELKQSVEQQKELVDVTRQQVLATMDEHDRRRAIEQASIQPRFVLECTGSDNAAENSMQWNFSIANEGETVTEIVVHADPPPMDPSQRILALRRNERDMVRLRYPGYFQFPSEVVLDIEYKDMTDTSGHDRHVVSVPPGKQPHYRNISVKRVARPSPGLGTIAAQRDSGNKPKD